MTLEVFLKLIIAQKDDALTSGGGFQKNLRKQEKETKASILTYPYF